MGEDVEIKSIRNLVTAIKDTYNFDFGNYAITSFKRRIERVLSVLNCKNVDELIIKIKEDKRFFDTFLKEITVNTTEMFRDPSFWRKLRENVLPIIGTHQNIRIWHAACSSGEEVYSMAILLKEMDLLGRVQIIATDINQDVLAVAKKGIYPIRNMELNQSNYERFQGKGKLSDYFSEKDGMAHMDTSLIENVNFKPHDLVLGSGFSKFDLILCRNVLIYFNMQLQDQVVELFSNSLFKNSFLAIGSKETITCSKGIDKYCTFSIEEKIYQKTRE